MPAFFHEAPHLAFTARQEAPSDHTTPSNSTVHDLEVICAWPVSGQYGPGSRVLYYVLVAACVFARKVDWLRNASLAGALLLPVVAALHAIVLAAVHNDNAVDMDVYGAFQLCALGALAAPVTVRISQTYFNDPGRNTIFVWSCIVLAGLLSLTVEFYRLNPVSCKDESVSSDPYLFPYDSNVTCGLNCTEAWPNSPLRGGSANNIYVIPAPTKLTFNAATLLSAACCLPAILLCVWMWIKLLRDNSANKLNPALGTQETCNEKPDSGEASERSSNIDPTDITAPGAQRSKTDEVTAGTEILVVIFGAAVIAILFVGEWNLFSEQVSYQTEPIANIGQWQPIVGTGLVIFGSLYLLLARAMEQERNSRNPDSSPSVKLVSKSLHRLNNHIELYAAEPDRGSRIVTVVNRKSTTELYNLDLTLLGIKSAAVENLVTGRTVPIVQYYEAFIGPNCTLSLRLTSISLDDFELSRVEASKKTEQSQERAEHREVPTRKYTMVHVPKRPSLSVLLARLNRKIEIIRPIARQMIKISDWMFTTKALGNEELGTGKSGNYPVTPGEHLLNPHLSETRSIYGDRRQSIDSQTSRLSRQLSRPRSATVGSTSSDRGSPDRQPTPSKRKDTISTLDAGLGRRETLDVPTPASPMRTPSRNSQPTEDEIVATPGGQITITVSEEPATIDDNNR